MDCMCTFNGCAGTGVAHCSPPCGGDLCVCVCGGEAECDGCDACDVHYDLDSPDFDDDERNHLP